MRASLSVLVCVACAGPPPVAPAPTAEAPTTAPIAEVSDGEGLSAALGGKAELIRLRPGTYEGRKPVLVGRTVTLEGDGTEVDALLIVTGTRVTVRGLRLNRGLSGRYARGLRVESSTISSSGRADSLSLLQTTAELVGVSLVSGRSTGVFAASSTVAFEDGRILATGSNHAMRVDAGRVRMSRMDLEGGSASVLWADRGAQVELDDVDITTQRPSAIGVHVTNAAVVDARRSQARLPVGVALLVREAEASWEDGILDARGTEPALGVAGGAVEVRSSTVTSGAGGVGSVGAFRTVQGNLRIDSTFVRMTSSAGITVGRGRLILRDSRIVGPGAGPLDPGQAEAAVIANGSGAAVDLRRVELRRLPGFGVLSSNDAQVTVDTTTVADAAGGIWLEDVRWGPPTVSRVRIRGCRSEPGLGFVRSTVGVRDAIVADCSTGVLAGERSRVDVDGLTVLRAERGVWASLGGRVDLRNGRARSVDRWGIAGCVGRSRIGGLGTETGTTGTSLCR